MDKNMLLIAIIQTCKVYNNLEHQNQFPGEKNMPDSDEKMSISF